MDLRGHGKSSTEDEIDMSIEVNSKSLCFHILFVISGNQPFLVHMQTLCSDVQAVVKTMYGDTPPAIVLVGHRFVIYAM